MEQISVWLGACYVCAALYVSNLLGLQECEVKLRASVCDIVCFPSVMENWTICEFLFEMQKQCMVRKC